MAAPRKVRVPQSGGEVILTPGGEEPRVFQVEDHLVSPRTNDEQQRLLQLVDGARLATPKELGDKPGPDTTGGTPTGGK